MPADVSIRERVGDIPTPEFTSTPVATSVPLAEARVAIVTTAGLRVAGDVRLWQPTDGSFTVLPADARDVQLSHFSPNFDRTGFAADINVVYPVDRLEEMAAAGEIGSVANRNISFMGAQFDATFSTILLDSGPAAAKVLLEDNVDVVLLTPI
ncbi:MAG: glycine/sarcosine/betaine reductase selenoprotein B family protein [Acidimicrobiales bacterium]